LNPNVAFGPLEANIDGSMDDCYCTFWTNRH
jgi:hypothetical protein